MKIFKKKTPPSTIVRGSHCKCVIVNGRFVTICDKHLSMVPGYK